MRGVAQERAARKRGAVVIWLRLPPRLRYLWLNRERAWFYIGVGFWIGAPSYIVWYMTRAVQ